jgi:hypothetical protein
MEWSRNNRRQRAGGGTHGGGTVFEIARTATGYASTPTILVNFCALANCADGEFPEADLIADANGNLFGTASGGGAHGRHGVRGRQDRHRVREHPHHPGQLLLAR